MRNDLLDNAVALFQESGFQVFVPLKQRSLFDMLAKRDHELFLIKVLENIDSIKKQQASALKNLAGKLSASCLIIGERTKEYKLMGGVVYERYGIYTINTATLKDALSGNMPLKRYWKGKLIVNPKLPNINPSEIAKILGVSRESAYMYKKGQIKMEYSKALKLEKLGLELDSYDIFKPPSPTNIKLNGYLKDLDKLGFDVVPVYNKFDALAKERESLILKQESSPSKGEIDYLMKTSSLLESHPVIVSRADMENIGGVAVIRKREIKEAKKAKDVIKLVKEREKD